MRNILFLSALVCLVTLGCSKKDNPNPEVLYDFPKVNSVDGKYLFSKEEHFSHSSIGGTASFQFEGNKLLKRTGGYFGIATSGGWSGLYSTEIYDEINYESTNAISIITKDNLLDFEIDPSKRKFKLKKGLIIEKITTDDYFTNWARPDTIYYFYSPSRRLTKTIQHLDYAIVTRTFIYENDNLKKISTVKRDSEDNSVYSTAEEIFGGYDNKSNPLKGQTLWQNMLYRTLSKNNFTTYSFKSDTYVENRNWTLVYDANGNVDFSK